MRFPGFSDEWVKVSLGDIGETLIGLTYSPKDVVANDGTIVFRSSNIQDGMIDYTDLVRVNKPIKERIVTRENDILICARNGSQRLIGKNALLTKADEGNTFGAFMMIYRSDDNDVIHPILSTRRYISQVSENLGARINQITTSDLNSFEFYIPSNCIERRKIGKLFALINERIATQNKIIEDLKKLKSAIIEDIMNNSHAAYFTLGEVGTYVRGLTFSSDDIEDDSSALRVFRANNLNYGDYVSTKDVIYVEKIPTSPQILQPGDIVICMANGSSNLVGKNSVYNDENKFSTIGAFCGIYRTSESFVRWFLESKRYRYMVAKALQGGNGAIANLSGTDILNMKFPIITEPMKSIYNKLLTGLNNNIQTNNQLISLLLQKKAYLLKQLFI